MTREQHRKRGMLVLGGLIGAAVFVGCAYLYFHDGVRGDALVVAWWVSGLVAAGFGVAACTVEDDGIERPRYLGSLLSGLRQEWTHPAAASPPQRPSPGPPAP
ncbi:hypothetical protein [Mumia sp. DW29H23]|uniref:hypothetical protein n=1 Tax=Mumia sp. DW29H23 TaxID=3421241 RepID=UPI003D6930DB